MGRGQRNCFHGARQRPRQSQNTCMQASRRNSRELSGMRWSHLLLNVHTHPQNTCSASQRCSIDGATAHTPLSTDVAPCARTRGTHTHFQRLLQPPSHSKGSPDWVTTVLLLKSLMRGCPLRVSVRSNKRADRAVSGARFRRKTSRSCLRSANTTSRVSIQLRSSPLGVLSLAALRGTIARSPRFNCRVHRQPVGKDLSLAARGANSHFTSTN